MITFITIFSFFVGALVTLSAVHYYVTVTVDKFGCFIFTGKDDMFIVTKPKMSLQALVGFTEIEYSKGVLKEIEEYTKELNKKNGDK